MPVDLTALNKAVQDSTDEATKTETTDASVIAILNGQADATKAAVAKAVTEALAADNASTQSVVDAATAAVVAVNARFVAADNNLGAAVTANTPSA